MLRTLDYTFAYTVAALLALAGIVATWFGAQLLRRHRPSLSLGKSLVLCHAFLVVLEVASFPAAVPLMPPFYDDVYLLFFIAPGLHLYFLASLIASYSTAFLLAHFSGYWAGLTGIVFLPAVYGIVLGSVQWILVAQIIKARTRLARAR